MANKVAVILTNYNMPERANALRAYVAVHAEWPLDFIMVDNGSDLVEPSQYTSLRLGQNIQTTGGWLMGLEYSDYLARKNGEPYFAYWIMGTSMEFVEESLDPLTPLATLLVKRPDAVAVHAALTEDSTTAHTNMWERPQAHGPRQTFRMDLLATLIRADWLNDIGRFDPDLTYAWGVPQETCWKARKQTRSLWIHEGTKIKKVSDIGYTMGRMNMTRVERGDSALAEKTSVLAKKYGDDWYDKIENEFVEPEWR